MPKQILAIPDHHLKEVVNIIRVGLANGEINYDARKALEKWCEQQEDYLEEVEEEDWSKT